MLSQNTSAQGTLYIWHIYDGNISDQEDGQLISSINVVVKSRLEQIKLEKKDFKLKYEKKKHFWTGFIYFESVK